MEKSFPQSYAAGGKSNELISKIQMKSKSVRQTRNHSKS